MAFGCVSSAGCKNRKSYRVFRPDVKYKKKRKDAMGLSGVVVGRGRDPQFKVLMNRAVQCGTSLVASLHERHAEDEPSMKERGKG